MVNLDYLTSDNRSFVVLCNEMNNNVIDFLRKQQSYVISGFQSPFNTQIKEVQDILGMDFTYDLHKVGNQVYKMVKPSGQNLRGVAERLCECIDYIKSLGKNDSVVRNVYYKFLCWMRFIFKDVLQRNVGNIIQYQGDLDMYKLMILYIVSGCGYKVVAISSSSLDSGVVNKFSIGYLNVKTAKPSVKTVNSSESTNKFKIPPRPVSVPKPKYRVGTNMWLDGDKVTEIFKLYHDRSGEEYITKSALIQVNGVADKTSYMQELFSMYTRRKSDTVVINSDFAHVTPNDINDLRSKYKSDDFIQYVLRLCQSLSLSTDAYEVLASEFVNIVKDITKKKEETVLDVFFILKSIIKGSTFTDRHYLYFMQTKSLTQVQCWVMYLLSCIMFDVVIFNPNQVVSDAVIPMVYAMNFPDRLDVAAFPITEQDLVIETTAFSASTELDSLLYSGDAGIFRDRQFKQITVAYLKPYNDEIDLLWRQNLSVRQGFMADGGVVIVPTIFFQLLGVRDSDIQGWCKRLDTLIEDTDNVLYNHEKPFFMNPVQVNSASVVRNRKLDFKLLSKHDSYPYSYLGMDIQMYMFDRLQSFLDSGIISGVNKHRIENDVLGVFVSLNSFGNLIRMIQNFDFTKKSPKVVYTWMEQDKIPLHDIILMHYLNHLGFDVGVLVPTGYNVMDAYIDKKVFSDYREAISMNPFTVRHGSKGSFFNKLFRR